MYIPTEEEIQAVTSELSTKSESHEHDNGECETCAIIKEFQKRGENSPTSIDEILLGVMATDPLIALGISVAGIKKVCDIIRISFYVGVKVGMAHEASKDLEKLVNLPSGE